MAEPIFGAEEGARVASIGMPLHHQRPQVAAGAEALSSAMLDDDGIDGGVGLPSGEPVQHRLAHGEVQRMGRLGPAQGDEARPALDPEADLVGHSRSPKSAVPIRTWVEPSITAVSKSDDMPMLSPARPWRAASLASSAK